MKIIYKTGNLLDATEPVILHGCNARGRMNSGVAKAIREKWPGAYQVYRDRWSIEGLKLGDVVNFRPSTSLVIANAVTQKDYGYDGKRYVSYDALEVVLNTMNSFLSPGRPIAIALPKIGAGLGGGNWEVISAIIETTLTDVQPVVYTLERDDGDT